MTLDLVVRSHSLLVTLFRGAAHVVNTTTVGSNGQTQFVPLDQVMPSTGSDPKRDSWTEGKSYTQEMLTAMESGAYEMKRKLPEQIMMRYLSKDHSQLIVV